MSIGRETTAKFTLYIVMVTKKMPLDCDEDGVQVEWSNIQDPDIHRPVCLQRIARRINLP
jgi:hypothetical protein